jgi:hypothetical protein
MLCESKGEIHDGKIIRPGVLATWYICSRIMRETYELKAILVTFISRRAISAASVKSVWEGGDRRASAKRRLRCVRTGFLVILEKCINNSTEPTSVDPQDAQRDRQTRSVTCPVSYIFLFLPLALNSRTDIPSSQHSHWSRPRKRHVAHS